MKLRESHVQRPKYYITFEVGLSLHVTNLVLAFVIFLTTATPHITKETQAPWINHNFSSLRMIWI